MRPRNDLIIRSAASCDAAVIARIYAPFVSDTAVTFDEEIPTAAAMSHKIDDIVKMYPFLVAQQGDQIVGYAYASPFRPRASFRWTVEVTVYVNAANQRQGIGRSLYEVLLPTLTKHGFVTAYAVITLPGLASVAMHEAFGFKRIAVFQKVGFKLGQWHDVGYWERRLNTPTANPAEPE